MHLDTAAKIVALLSSGSQLPREATCKGMSSTVKLLFMAVIVVSHDVMCVHIRTVTQIAPIKMAVQAFLWQLI